MYEKMMRREEGYRAESAYNKSVSEFNWYFLNPVLEMSA